MKYFSLGTVSLFHCYNIRRIIKPTFDRSDGIIKFLPLNCSSNVTRKPLEIETWVQRTTNRKWSIPSPMVTWPMTSRDPERSRSWPQYVWCPLSRKRLELATWWQCSAYRKWAPGNRMVTWPMPSRDPEMSRSWPQCSYRPISRKRLEIPALFQKITNR